MNRPTHTPNPTQNSRRRTDRRRRLITPLMAGVVVAASLLTLVETPTAQTPATNHAAATEVSGEAGGAARVSNTQTRTAVVRPVSLTRPAPEIRGGEPLTCPAGRSSSRGRSGESAIQIDIRLEQPTRPRGSSRRESTRRESTQRESTRGESTRRDSDRRDSARRGGQPLVVGCGPDGQIVVLACDTRRASVDDGPWGSRDRRGGYRDRTRFDSDYRDGYDLADLEDLELSDLLDLSEDTGLSLDELVERAELDGLEVDGPTGRIELGNPHRRHNRSDTTRAGWWDLYTTPRSATSDRDGTAMRPRALASDGSSHKAEKARTARMVRAGDQADSAQRGLRGRGERSGVCRWLGH